MHKAEAFVQRIKNLGERKHLTFIQIQELIQHSKWAGQRQQIHRIKEKLEEWGKELTREERTYLEG